MERVERGRRGARRRGRSGERPPCVRGGRSLDLEFRALQIPATSARVGWAARPGVGSEVGQRRLFILVAGGNPALPLAAPRKHARVPGPACARPRSLTGPASALLAGKSLKTLMSKGILQVHPPICDCPGCRISSPVVRCGRKPGASGSCFSSAELGLCFLESVLTSTLPGGRREPPGANK